MTKTLEGYLLIADITGYTLYLSQSELDHAQEILTALLELLLDHTRPPLVLSRLAGDAVISYGLGDHFYQGQTFIEVIEDTYVAFRKAIEQMVLNNTCRCKACANIASLDLKFFIHYGSFAVQHIVDHDELVGSDVNLIHRLLKNHVTEQTGLAAYMLYTGPALQRLNMPGLEQTMLPLEEAYEHLGAVQVWVKDMHPIWEQKKAAMPVTIPPEQVMLSQDIDLDAPPERVWDYLIRPEFRNTLIGSDRQDVADLVHGRVVQGSVFQCIHGSHITPLTILTWQPFAHLLMQSAMPVPGTNVQVEVCLSPTPGGTRLTQTFSKPRGPLPARLACTLLMRTMVKKVHADIAAFKAQVQADIENQPAAQPAMVALSKEAVRQEAVRAALAGADQP